MSLGSGSSLVILGSWVWRALWVRSHLGPGLDSVRGLVHLHLDAVDGVVGLVDQLFDDILCKALQKRSPVPGQGHQVTSTQPLLPCMAALANKCSQSIRTHQRATCSTAEMAMDLDPVKAQ